MKPTKPKAKYNMLLYVVFLGLAFLAGMLKLIKIIDQYPADVGWSIFFVSLSLMLGLLTTFIVQEQVILNFLAFFSIVALIVIDLTIIERIPNGEMYHDLLFCSWFTWGLGMGASNLIRERFKRHQEIS